MIFPCLALALLLMGSFSVFGQETTDAVPLSPPAPAAVATAGTRLTWADCIGLAIIHNPDLQAAREALLNSDALHSASYSALYPQVFASFNDTRAYAGPYLAAPANYTTAYSSQLSITQTIFNGFLTKGNIDQARAELALAFATLNSQKAATSYDLKSSFAQLIYAQKLIELNRNIIAIRQDNARFVKLLYDGGHEDKGAMLLSQAQLDQAVNNYNVALRTDELSAVQLAIYIGQDLPEPVEGVGELQTDALPVKPDFRKLAVLTPAFFQKRAQADASAAGITIAQSGFYPTITAGVAATRNDSGFPPKQTGFSGGFTVSYPIFEGGLTYFNVKAARAAFRESLAELSSGTDLASLNLAQTFKTLVDDEDNVRIQEELLNATALRYKIAQASYRNGLISFQDFTTITDSYVGQQQTCLASQRDAVIAEANWEQSRGLGAIP